MALLPEVLPGITGFVAQVGNVAPPLLLLAQLALAPYSVLPLPNVSTCRIAPMFGSFSTKEISVPANRKAGRGSDRSDTRGVGKDEFRIRETTQRCPGPAVKLIEGDDVGLGTVRPGSNGAPVEICQRVCITQRDAAPWRERVHRNCSSRRNRHDAVGSSTAKIPIDRCR